MYESITTATILKEAAKYPAVMHYLPDSKDVPRLPRQWLLNVIYTVVGQEFAAWINLQIERRNQERASEQQLMIDLDPEVAKAFRASTHVSTR